MTPLRELYDLYCYPSPAKEERRQQLLAEIPTDARDEDNYGRTSLHIAAEFADREAIASLLNRGELTYVERIGNRRMVAGVICQPRYIEGIDSEGKVWSRIQVKSVSSFAYLYLFLSDRSNE